MTAIQEMAANITTWLKQNTFGVSGYVGVSGVLGQVQPTTIKYLGSIVGTAANINILVAIMVGVITLTIKGMELYDKIKARRKETEHETTGDSRRVGKLRRTTKRP